MKHLKRLFTALLLLCATAATAHDFEVDGIFYNVLSTTDRTVSVTYKGNSYSEYSNEYRGAVIIPASVTYGGSTYSVTGIGSVAFDGCSGLTSIVIPNSVTSIGNSVFYNCSGLTSVEIPNSVTSIGYSAFYGCTRLTSIEIPNSVTSIGNSVFYNCSGLTSIVIPGSVTSIGDDAFYGCGNLKVVVNLSDLTFTRGSTSNGYVAYYATDYRVYNAPQGRIEGDFVLGKPNDVKTLVGYLGSAKTATLPADYDGDNYVIGANAFRNRTSLTGVEIPNSVTSIGYSAFYGCTRLTSIEIPNSVTSIGNSVFYNCSGLTSVEIPNSVTSIGYSAFYGCTRLTSIEIPNSVTSIGSSAFEGCSGLISVEIPNSVTSIPYGAFRNCSGLTSVEIPNSVTSIGNSVFYNCSGLTSIVIPGSVTSIGDDAFYGCGNLKVVVNLSDLTIVKGNSSNGYVAYYANNVYDAQGCVVDGDYIFSKSGGVNTLVAYCGSTELTQLTLPANCEGENYVIGDYLFYGFKKLRSVTIGSGALSVGNSVFSTTPTKVIFLGNTPPSGVSKIKGTVNYVSSAANYGFGTEYTNLSSMFEVGGVKYVLVSAKDRTCDVIDCNYNNPVEDVVIDSLVTYRNVKLKVRDVNDYALYDNDNIKSAVIKNNGYIGSYAFYDCDRVVNATLGNSVGAINNYAFASCGVLEEIVIPDNVPSVGSYCFENCTSLEKAFIGAGVEALNTKTFSGCSSLNEVKIGENVATIGTYVFENCSSLPQINIPQATRTINNYVFKGCQNLSTVVIEDKVFSLSLGSNGSSPLFADCKLDSVYIGGKLQYNKTSSYGYSPFYANKYLRSVTYNDMEEAIYDREFMNCSNLQNIVFGKGITSIGVSAFKNCTSLPGITIPDEVLTMGNSCFAGCTALKNAKVGTGVKTLEWYSFGTCTALTDMQIGVNVDSIGKSVFYGCSALPEIKIPQATRAINDSVFYKCTSLADVIIEDRTTTLRLGSNGSSSSSTATASTNPLFHSCPLDSVYIGGKISYKTDAIYGFSPFFRNTSLRTVVVSDTETLVYDNEFYGCTGLTDVVIGDGVTAIGNWAFSGCTGLVNFSFGSSVETIGAEAFSDCTSMVKIVSSCNVPPVCGDQALADINVWDCTLYVPNDYIDAYYNAEQWWDFFFIDGAEYTLLFMVDGEVYSESIIKYNSEITLPDDPVKKGHTFIGWGDVPAVMPAENITLNAEFSINNYTIKYIVDGKEYHSETIEYNTEIIPIEAPEKDGYEFNCWQALPLTMPDNDVEVVAVYDEIPTELIITIGQYGSTVYSSKYTLDFSNVEGLKAYAATGYNTNSGIITMTRVNTADSGTGLYLKGSPGQYSVPVIDYSDDNSLNMLVGNLEKSIVNALSNDGMYANYKYTIKSGDAAPMFYQYSDGSSISAGKAYLQIPTAWLGSQPSRSIGIRFDEGETTDIDKVKGENGKAKGIYDLKGYKIESVTTPGVYIIDGKKVYIK